jgi:glycosyltransferase involved in cell wall biosynthesis
MKGIREFDIIHLHQYRTFQNVAVSHYARKYGLPYILQAHGSLETFFSRGHLKRIFDVVWGHHILRNANRLIAVTPMEVEQYQKLGIREDKIEIVPNAIDSSQFETLPKHGEFKRRYGLSNEKIILYLGRIASIKGVDLLVRAFVRLLSDINSVRLVIAGPDDGYLGTLKNLISELRIEDKVLFPGAIYGREKLEAYVDAEVYVLPSTYEIFGMTILEACACSTPVIVTDQCGIADIIDGKAGIVVPRDEDKLRSALGYLLTNDKKRQELGEQGRLLVRQQFTWSKVAESMEGIYHSILKRGDGSS